MCRCISVYVSGSMYACVIVCVYVRERKCVCVRVCVCVHVCVCVCMCVHLTWHIRMCDTTLHIWDMTYSYLRYYLFMCEKWIIHKWDVTHSYVRHGSLMCMATHPYVTCDMTHSYVRSTEYCIHIWHVSMSTYYVPSSMYPYVTCLYV